MKILFLLFFPEIKELEDKWWHKFMEVVSIIFGIMGFIIFFVYTYDYFQSGQCWVNGYTNSYGSYISGYYRECAKDFDSIWIALILSPIIYVLPSIVYRILLYIFYNKKNKHIESYKPVGDSYLEEIRELGDLLHRGVLTKSEFEKLKREVLKNNNKL